MAAQVGRKPGKSHKTAVVWIPPLALWEPIQQIRRQYDRKIHRWMPHITLLYPFVPLPFFASTVPALARALQQCAPFETHLRQFRWFQHSSTSFTLWLRPEPVEKWKELASNLVSHFPAYQDQMAYPSGFVPHLSVGQFHGTEQEVRTLCDQLQRQWTPLSTTVTALFLIYRDDPPYDRFRIGARIAMGSPE